MPLNVVNPYNQEVYCMVPLLEEPELEKRLDQARSAFEQWSTLSYKERESKVQQALSYFTTNQDTIAKDITMQMGRPLQHSINEVKTMLDRASHMISIGEATLASDEFPEADGLYRRIDHVPLGVVLDIVAWNYPLLIAINVVIPALLAGNSVLIKHSAKTPLCGLHFEKAFESIGIPGLVTNLVITHKQTSQVIRDDRVDHVVFTGSVEGGAEVYQDVAKRFIDVGLELGGNDPAYVAEDADLDYTVENIIDGACYNAGQSCCAIERVYVHQNVHDEFLKRAVAILKTYKLGDPMDPNTNLGPLANKFALQSLSEQVQDALEQGAKLLFGGKRIKNVKGNFFEPTLLSSVSNDTIVMQEESFGPIIPVQKVTSDQQALEQMNDTRFGLTASVWTQSSERAEWFASRLNAGTIYQNRSDYCDPALPWSGVGESGKGASLSRYGFYHLTRLKSINFRRNT